MKDATLTAGDMQEITGVNIHGLSVMTANAVVNPGGGNGKGRHKTYRLIDAVSLAYAVKYAEALGERNVHLGIDAGRFIQNVGLHRIESELAAGNTVLIPPLLEKHGNACFIPGPSVIPAMGGNTIELKLPDLKETYEAVKAKVAEILSRPIDVNQSGRTTGLVCNQKHGN
jgi:hypothetical protein